MNYVDIVKRLIEDTEKGLIPWREGMGWWNVRVKDCLFSVYSENKMLQIFIDGNSKLYLSGECADLVKILKEKYVVMEELEEDKVAYVFRCLDTV